MRIKTLFPAHTKDSGWVSSLYPTADPRQKPSHMLDAAVHTFDFSAWVVEAGRFLSWSLAWSTE